MPRSKNVEVKSLLIADVQKRFKEILNRAKGEVKLTDKQIAAKLGKNLEGLVSEYEDKLSTLYIDNHKFKIDNFLTSHFENQKRIVETNRDSFVAFILYVNASEIIYNKLVSMVGRKRLTLALKLNLSLYGLILRRAQQIVDLLISGYIDGAMIHWRALYENSVVLILLALEDNPDLSLRFYDHSIRNSRRKIASYTENYQELKFKPLPKRVFTTLEKEKQRLVSKYGKEFLDNDYGWADILFTGKANFRMLEERAQLDRFRPYYILCSEHIHSNFNGFKDFMEKNKIILPRLLSQEIELKRFIDPMQFTISILHEVNDYIIWQFSAERERNINILLLKKIFEKLLNTFDTKAL